MLFRSNALKYLRNVTVKEDNIIIHDAARPFVSAEMITNIIHKLLSSEGVIPVLPMKDTIYIGESGKIKKLLDRNQLLAGQAPEGFHFGKYYEANKNLMKDEIFKINGSTEPAIIANMDVAYIEGEEKNFKITTKEDLERFIQIVKGE